MIIRFPHKDRPPAGPSTAELEAQLKVCRLALSMACRSRNYFANAKTPPDFWLLEAAGMIATERKPDDPGAA